MIQMTYPLYQGEIHQPIHNQDHQVWLHELEKETFDNSTRTEAKKVNILIDYRFSLRLNKVYTRSMGSLTIPSH